MSLSVIVTSYGSPQSLRQCLESLAIQPEAGEIIVADCSPEDPAETVGSLFPQVLFLNFREKRTVPQMRWEAYRHATGATIAAVEARCRPARDWCATLLRAHEKWPDAPAAGGPVAFHAPASARDLGLYFCEYGLYAPPVQEGPVRELSGANLSYKREALEQCRDLLDAGAWETLLHDRWRKQGRTLIMCPATVIFENGMDLNTILEQRFVYGRGYAAARLPGAAPLRRIVYAGFCSVLPFLLAVRLWNAAREKALSTSYWRAFGWILLFSCAWSLGEMAGYLLGKAKGNPIF